MRFAVISDVHSNLRALKSVFDDIEKRGIQTVYCTGDLVGYLTDPNGVINFLREKQCQIIRGNHDEKYIDLSRYQEEEISEILLNKGGSFLYTNQQLTDDNRQFLKELPERIIVDDILFIHGSPYSSSEYMYAGDEIIKKVSVETEYKYIFYGHTHIPNYEIVKGVSFINPGSVGKPKHGNSKASYVEFVKTDALEVLFHQVNYDLLPLLDEIDKEALISNKLMDDLRQNDIF